LCMYGSETHALAADTLLSSIDEALAQARFDDLRSFTLKSGLGIRPFPHGTINIGKFPLLQEKGVDVVIMDLKEPLHPDNHYEVYKVSSVPVYEVTPWSMRRR